jgi:hypothetical protein
MTEFKKELLYVNQEGIEAQTKQIESGATALNGFILEAESVLKCKFTDKEKQALKSDGIAFIKGLVKAKFPFPDASEDFNLNSLGLTNVKNLYSNYERNSGSWIYFDYALTKGVFEASRLEKDKTVQSFSYYTQNEKQNRVLELAEKMIVLFDEAEKLGVLNGHGRKHITNVFDVLTVDVHPEIKEYRIMIHKRFLSTKYLY